MNVSTTAVKATTTILGIGDRGPEVIDLQYLLILFGGVSSEGHGSEFIDGDFGPTTQFVVRLFQGMRGLVQDGIVGPKTWGELVEASKWPTQSPGVFLRQGNLGAEALQRRLAANNFYFGPIDGDFGPLTHTGVVQLQRVIGRTNTDGVVGPMTFTAVPDTAPRNVVM